LGPFSGRGIEVDVVIDLMIHDIDILHYLLKATVKEIRAVGLSVLTPFADFANARIEYDNGCVASLTASRVSKEKVRRTRIFQSNGTLTIDYLTQKAFFVRRATTPGKREPLETVTEEIPVAKVDALEAEIHSFLQSVRDRKKVRVSGWDGRQALQVAFQVLEKIEEGKGSKKGRHN
jgi:predicted dehydrogenase